MSLFLITAGLTCDVDICLLLAIEPWFISQSW